MNETEEPRRPYPSPSNVIQVIHRARTRNLPDFIDGDFLRIAGIGDAVHGRVLDGMRFLGLIQPDGRPTDTLVGISGASEDEYKAILRTAIQEAYREDMERVDPTQDTQAQIVDAFRRYQPRSQHARMVMFFLAMCREAGMEVAESPRERGMRSPAARRTAPPPRRSHAQQNGQSRRARREPSTPPPPPSAPEPRPTYVLPDEDLALLDDADFDEVWSALGRVAKARARAKREQDLGSATERAHLDAREADES